jgi:AraC-like DNA-binding protein
MTTIQQYIHVVGMLQGVLLFVLLLFDNRSNVSSRILGFICLLMAAEFLKPFLLANSNTTSLVGWLFYLPAAGGSLAYLFCRSAILNISLRIRDGLLFLPLFGCYALGIGVFVASPDQFIIWVLGTPSSDWRLPASEMLLFAQAFGFAIATMFMIWRYYKSANDNLSSFNSHKFKWLLTLQVFTLIIWTLNALSSLADLNIVYAQIANLIMVIFIYVIAIIQWKKPDLFTVSQLAEECSKPKQSTNGELTETQRQSVFDDLKTITESEKLYLKNDLTLTDLAEACGISRQQVSETLNRHANKNFYEFINDYRISVVKRKLVQEKDNTILDIALQCGFSSKSSFNGIFKQYTGMTPSQFRRCPSQNI